MADFTGLISDYINNELSENERHDFKEKLKSDKDFFDEYILQKNIIDFMKFIYAKEMFEKTYDEKVENQIHLMYENWEKDKNSEEQLKTKRIIEKLFDEYDNEKIENEIEILDIETGFEDIDNEIDKMIEFSNQNDKDLDTKLLISDILDEIDNTKTMNPDLKIIEFPKRHKLNSGFCIIAAIGLILITITSILIFKTKPDGKILFADNYKNTVTSDINRDTTNVSKSQNDAFNYFLKKDYKNAAILFEQFINQYPEENSNYFNLAICSIEQRNMLEAETILIDYREKFPNVFVKATWYLGLCYLYTDDYDKAIIEFEKIKDTETYKELPEEIIRKIE